MQGPLLFISISSDCNHNILKPSVILSLSAYLFNIPIIAEFKQKNDRCTKYTNAPQKKDVFHIRAGQVAISVFAREVIVKFFSFIHSF